MKKLMLTVILISSFSISASAALKFHKGDCASITTEFDGTVYGVVISYTPNLRQYGVWFNVFSPVNYFYEYELTKEDKSKCEVLNEQEN